MQRGGVHAEHQCIEGGVHTVRTEAMRMRSRPWQGTRRGGSSATEHGASRRRACIYRCLCSQTREYHRIHYLPSLPIYPYIVYLRHWYHPFYRVIENVIVVTRRLLHLHNTPPGTPPPSSITTSILPTTPPLPPVSSPWSE